MVRSLAVALVLATEVVAQNPQPGSAEQGKRQFAQSCAFCHGSDAAGGEGPNLILSSLVRHDKTGEQISDVIRNGRPEHGMPPIPLTADQIADVIAYIRAQLKDFDRRSAGRPTSGYSLARLNTGNAASGKAFFAANCTGCHSATGDLRGIGEKLSPADLQSRFLYPSGTARTATIRTDSGVIISGTVLYQDPFAIAIRGPDGLYRSWLANEVKVDIADPLAKHRELLSKYTESDVHDVFAYLETLK